MLLIKRAKYIIMRFLNWECAGKKRLSRDAAE